MAELQVIAACGLLKNRFLYSKLVANPAQGLRNVPVWHDEATFTLRTANKMTVVFL